MNQLQRTLALALILAAVGCREQVPVPERSKPELTEAQKAEIRDWIAGRNRATNFLMMPSNTSASSKRIETIRTSNSTFTNWRSATTKAPWAPSPST